MIETRVFTMNMKRSVPRDRARAGLVRAAFRSQLGGCQEWGPGREIDLPGWSHDGDSRPNLWRRDLFRYVDGYVAVLAEGRRIRRLPGRKAILPDSVARVTVLEDLRTGEDTTIVNFHLPAAVETQGRPRRRSGPARLAMHAAAVEQLVEEWRAHDAHGVAYALGDTNVDTRADLNHHTPRFPAYRFAKAGALPCWIGNMPHRPDGTHGRRLIDVIYTDAQAKEVEQIANASDHDAVVALYLREVAL